MLKGLFSGGGSFLVVLLLREKLPLLPYILSAMLLGFVAYGLSIFLYIRAQRSLGAAKTSAYYAVAPFVGSLLSFVLIGEPLTGSYVMALLIMVAGTAFVVMDTLAKHHAHEHDHYGAEDHHEHHHAKKDLEVLLNL